MKKENKILQVKRDEMLEQALWLIKELATERKSIADGMYQDILDKVYASPIDIIFTRGLMRSEVESRYSTIGELVVGGCEKLKSTGVDNKIVRRIEARLKSCGLYFVSDLKAESWILVAKSCDNCWCVQNNIPCSDNARWWGTNLVYIWLRRRTHCKKDGCIWSFVGNIFHCGSFFKEITDNFWDGVGVLEKMSMVDDLAEESLKHMNL